MIVAQFWLTLWITFTLKAVLMNTHLDSVVLVKHQDAQSFLMQLKLES